MPNTLDTPRDSEGRAPISSHHEPKSGTFLSKSSRAILGSREVSIIGDSGLSLFERSARSVKILTKRTLLHWVQDWKSTWAIFGELCLRKTKEYHITAQRECRIYVRLLSFPNGLRTCTTGSACVSNVLRTQKRGADQSFRLRQKLLKSFVFMSLYGKLKSAVWFLPMTLTYNRKGGF